MSESVSAATVGKQVAGRVRDHSLTLVSAGVAFYAFLALIPTLIVVVSIYGLVADPSDITKQVKSFAGALPEEVQKFITFQLRSIAESSSGSLSITLVVALAIALWGASGGMAALITGIHVAHEKDEPKGFVAKRGKALYLTLGALVVLGLIVFLVAALPSFLDNLGLGSGGRTAVNVLRWPVLAVVMVLGVGLLYRLTVGPAAHGWGVVSRGALVATGVWIVGSALFAVYTSQFASYAKTYGSLAVIVVLMLWLYVSALALLLGAEVDAVGETAPSRSVPAPAG